MAQIFKQAQDTILFQNEHARARQKASGGEVNVKPRKQREWYHGPSPCKGSRKDHLLEDSSGLSRTAKVDFLPSFAPVGRLSEDLPANLWDSVKAQPDEDVALELNASSQQNPTPEASGHLLLASGQTTKYVHDAPRSTSANPLGPNVESRHSPIQAWLDGVISPATDTVSDLASPPRTTSAESDSSQPLDTCTTQHDNSSCEHQQTLLDGSPKRVTLISPPRRAIRSLLSPTFPSMKMDMGHQAKKEIPDQSRVLPTRFKPRRIPAQQFGLRKLSCAGGSHRSDSNAEIKSGSESTEVSVPNEVAEGMVGVASAVESKTLGSHSSKIGASSEDNAADEEVPLADLSPNVETIRRSKVRRPRCISYFDEDILPEMSPGRKKREEHVEGQDDLGEKGEALGRKGNSSPQPR